MSEYYRVPQLGPHYTQRWAKEDLENERLKSAAASGSGSGAEKDDKAEVKGENTEEGKMMKKAEAVAET